MSRRSPAEIAGNISTLPHLETVESFLQMPLLPYPDYVTAPQQEVPDVRQTIHDLAVAHLRHKHRLPPTGVVDLSGLTESQLAQTASSTPWLDAARRRVTFANEEQRSWQQPPTRLTQLAPPDSPIGRLSTSMTSALHGLAQHPRPMKIVSAQQGLAGKIGGALLLDSSTGSGKTPPLLELLRRGGIGKPIGPPELGLGKAKALLVVPDQSAIRRYLDDELVGEILGPDIDTGSIWEEAKDLDASLAFITDESLMRGIEEGWLSTNGLSAVVLDEAHRYQGRGMRKVLHGMAHLVVAGATGTPKMGGRRGPQRDVRDIFVHKHISTPRSSAEQGVTRPVEMAVYEVRSTQKSEALAVKLACEYIERGMRVAVYCQGRRPGEEDRQAQRIANAINATDDLTVPGWTQPEGGNVVSAVGDFMTPRQDRESLQALMDGTERGFVATNKRVESLNMGVDVVICIGPMPQWKVDQIAGRAARPGDEYAYLIEIQGEDIAKAGLVGSFLRTYEISPEEFRQGIRIGRTPRERKKGYYPGYDIGPLDAATTPEPVPGQKPAPTATQRPAKPVSAEQTARLPIDEASDTTTVEATTLQLDPELLEALAATSLVGTVLLGRAEVIAAEIARKQLRYLSKLAHRYNVPQSWLRYVIDQYPGALEKDIVPHMVGKTLIYEPAYGKQVESYLRSINIRQLAAEARLTPYDIAELTLASTKYVTELLRDHGLLSSQKLVEQEARFSLQELLPIFEHLEQLPIAELTDIAANDLARELNDANFVFQRINRQLDPIDARPMRRNPALGTVGVALHISAADADRIRAEYRNPPIADDTWIDASGISDLALVELSLVLKELNVSIPPEERPAMQRMRSSPDGRGHNFMLRTDAQPIIDRLRPGTLPPYLAPLQLIARYFGATPSGVRRKIMQLRRNAPEGTDTSKYEAERKNIGGTVGRVTAWLWELVEEIEQSGWRPDASQEPIRYADVARGPDAPLQAKDYSQSIQRRHISADRLEPLQPNTEERGEEHLPQTQFAHAHAVQRQLGIDATALRYMERLIELQPDEIMHDDDGIAQYAPSAVARMDAFYITPGPPQWERFGSVTRSFRGISANEVYDELIKLLEAPDAVKRTVPADMVRLGRSGQTVEIYLSRDCNRRLRKVLLEIHGQRFPTIRSVPQS